MKSNEKNSVLSKCFYSCFYYVFFYLVLLCCEPLRSTDEGWNTDLISNNNNSPIRMKACNLYVY